MRRYFSSAPLLAQHFSLLTKTTLVFSAGLAMACDTEGQDPDGFDANGDYIADHLGTPLDKNGDGQITWADAIDINGDGIIDGIGIDEDGDGVPDGAAIDTDGDDILDTLDRFGNGGGMNGTGGSASGGAVNGTGGGVGPGTGGAIGATGGSPGTGGGAPGTGGGAPGAGGGAPGAGGAAGGGSNGGGGPVACTIDVSSSMVSQTMRTVGLIDFTSDLSGATDASVEFGLDTSYGMTAPAESMGAGYHAMLVGMKPNSTYHYRVMVAGPGGNCAGPDQTIESGPIAQGISTPTMAMTGEGAAPGFMIVATGTQAIIVDKDGDVVWGSVFPAGQALIGVTSAKLSWDGKYMVARDLGPFNAGSGGNIWRVPLDGSSDAQKLDVAGGHHHDFTVIPEGIAYIAKQQQGQCDHIFTANADGSNSQSLVDLDVVFGQYPQAGFGGEACHVNAIKYYHDRQLFSVSDREKDVIGILGADGSLKMAVGQQPSGSLPITPVIAEGAKTTWRVQHGHDYYEDNKLLVFSNHDFGSQQSPVLHYTINGANASLDWQYDGHPGSSTQGDVDMLPNGNVLVTSSEGGEVHELSPSQQVIGRYKFQGQIGYVDHRTSLYGPPD